MKIVFLIARLLLGLTFLVFGLNGFLHFIHMPPPGGLAGQYLGALVASHYTVVIFGLQVIGGLLLLVGRFVPLGLTLLAPLIVNILLFHLLMEPSGLPLALLITLLWAVSAWAVRGAFAGILAPNGTETSERRL